eukprot:scaffold7474_cov63-Phaeocystis_antarctica.AAC.4
MYTALSRVCRVHTTYSLTLCAASPEPAEPRTPKQEALLPVWARARWARVTWQKWYTLLIDVA